MHFIWMEKIYVHFLKMYSVQACTTEAFSRFKMEYNWENMFNIFEQKRLRDMQSVNKWIDMRIANMQNAATHTQSHLA